MRRRSSPATRTPFRAATAAAPGAVRGRLPDQGRNRLLRKAVGSHRRRGGRGRHVLLDVPAHRNRPVPGRRVHQHAVRDHGRRRHPRGAGDRPRRARRTDHRRRADHPGAHRVQRGLRLRPGGDGQLGVLRQPNPASARELVESIRAGQTPQPTRGAPVCPFTQTARPWPGWGRRPPTPPDPAPRRWPGCGWREQDES